MILSRVHRGISIVRASTLGVQHSASGREEDTRKLRPWLQQEPKPLPESKSIAGMGAATEGAVVTKAAQHAPLNAATALRHGATVTFRQGGTTACSRAYPESDFLGAQQPKAMKPHVPFLRLRPYRSPLRSSPSFAAVAAGTARRAST